MVRTIVSRDGLLTSNRSPPRNTASTFFPLRVLEDLAKRDERVILAHLVLLVHAEVVVRRDEDRGDRTRPLLADMAANTLRTDAARGQHRRSRARNDLVTFRCELAHAMNSLDL